MGLLFSIKAILTVNSALWLINSFVPSNGSTSQNLNQFFLTSQSTKDSSERIGISALSSERELIINLFEDHHKQEIHFLVIYAIKNCSLNHNVD